LYISARTHQQLCVFFQLIFIHSKLLLKFCSNIIYILWGVLQRLSEEKSQTLWGISKKCRRMRCGGAGIFKSYTKTIYTFRKLMPDIEWYFEYSTCKSRGVTLTINTLPRLCRPNGCNRTVSVK
jgi:hypothetical protein